jgi:hypothetical protein
MNGYNTAAIGAIEPAPSTGSEQALIAAERGNAGKRPERLDGGVQHMAVSLTVPPTYVIMLVPIKR